MMRSPLQPVLDTLLQSAMLNLSDTFDEQARQIIEGITLLKQRRPAMRGWMLGREKLSYRTDRYGLQCTDTCAKTWAIVDYRDKQAKFYSLLGN